MCLFEPQASLHVTPLGLSTARYPQRSEGAQTAGRLSFAYFSLATQRKVSRCRATPTSTRANPPVLAQGDEGDGLLAGCVGACAVAEDGLARVAGGAAVAVVAHDFHGGGYLLAGVGYAGVAG